MCSKRLDLYKKLERNLDTKLLVYVTSDRPRFGGSIAYDAIDPFINQLDQIGNVPKISLYLYTLGGNTAAAWNIVNLIRQYCKELQVIVPHKAHSGGTLISIGANSIIMTKQATLSPIDPSINTPLNPKNPSGSYSKYYPVSVEAVKGYLAFAKEELAIKDDMALSSIMIKLSDFVHPLVLGEVYRSRAQIKMLAEKLLINQVTDMVKLQQIIAFLCSDSGSHDYTINRREAKALGLSVDKPDDERYRIIKDIYDNINNELGFNVPFNLSALAKSNPKGCKIKRVLIESVAGGSNYYVFRGKVETNICPDNPEPELQLMGTEGWEHERDF